MSEKLTNLAQLRMTAEKSKELSAQIAAAVAEAIEELGRNKANTAHSHTAADVGALSTSGGSVNGHVCFSDGNADGSSLNIDDYEISYTDAYGSGILLSAITGSGGNGCKVYVLSGSASLLCTLRNFVEMGWTDTWIDMEGNRITNVKSISISDLPSYDEAAANKKYVDDSIAAALGQIETQLSAV